MSVHATAIRVILHTAHPKNLQWEEKLQLEHVLNCWLHRHGYKHQDTQRCPEVTKLLPSGVKSILDSFDPTSERNRALIADSCTDWLYRSGYFDFTVGTKVRTTIDLQFMSKDWQTDPFKRKGVTEPAIGVIKQCHGSHGVCYTVTFESGEQHCYDPWELEKIR